MAKRLHVDECPALTTIPHLPSLTSLHLDGCALRTVSSLPQLEYLDVRNAPKLTAISNLPKVESIRLRNTCALKRISGVPALKLLHLRSMPRPGSLPDGDYTIA